MSSNIVESFREYVIGRMNCYKMTKANLPVRAELANVCEHLKELIENNGWISVQKLPTIDRPVLLSNNLDYSGDIVIARLRLKKQLPHSLQIFVDDGGYFEVQGMPKNTLSSIALPSDFTHWQYLPELPKE